ncbi:protein-glutamate O-methyltransferase [uncultured Pelagimonas sp.]|uniref:CheR family methyltransferase n=1 Tax=uncultured Pelagimonas sp. TaxID=1618102 RepID=UPI002601F85E|nr:protein-glutamate O-methyltransferase [uncultured Pelagimonas sp.]
MKTASINAESKEIPFSDRDFGSLACLAKSKFGLNLAESKKPLVYSRLSKRLRARNVSSFSDYISLLSIPAEESERFELISALTTNVTSFFRENHHFETLQEVLSTELIPKAKSGHRVRIWSAGCSSGPEPYSTAMTIFNKFPDVDQYDVKILATDIDPKVVSKAREGKYSIDELDGISDIYRHQWIKLVDEGSNFIVSDKLKNLITFNELNLMSNWPFNGPFDVIFCRNVAIYFDQATQQNLWSRFCDLLTPKGLLFIGHSERVTGPATGNLEGIGITSYRKVTNRVQNTQNRSV